MVDVWTEYARLRDDEGWAQERIARAKGGSQGTVSLRLKFHDKLPMEIKEYIARAIIAEMPEPVLDVIINNGNFAKIYNNIQLITCAPTKRW